MIKGVPTWIGSGTEAVLAWIHTPHNATSQGIVVIAPPAGREQALSALAVRRLAILLAQSGYTAVRFAWRGSMDSQPLNPLHDVVETWQTDLRAVVAGTRDLLGADDLPVHAVGYRTGAAVLGSIVDEFDTVVSWEPVAGKAFVRQWSRLRRTVAPHVPEADGEVDLLGMAVTTAQAQRFATLPVPVPTPESQGDRAVVVEVKEEDKRRAKAMYGVEPFETRLHDDVFLRVIGLLPRGREHRVAAHLATALENTWTDERGQRLSERIVEIGPEQRVGIVTWRADEGAPGRFRDAHGVVVSGGGPDGRFGSGEWPLVARSLASDGLVTLRVDRPMVGDSTPLDAIRATNSYTMRSAAGFKDSTDWLRHNGCTQISAALMCASAWAGCLGEIRGTPVDAQTIVLVSHSEWKMSEKLWAEARETYDADAVRGVVASSNRGARRGAVPPRPQLEIRRGVAGVGDRLRWVKELARTGGRREVGNWAREQAVLAVRTRMPYGLWSAASRAGVMETPEHVLGPMSKRARVVVLNGPDDLSRWQETRGDRAVEKLAAAGRQITAVASDRLDHSVITATGARTVLETLRTELLGQRRELATPVTGTSSAVVTEIDPRPVRSA